LEGKDTIKELFSEKLGSYEAKVNPELWGKVASQLGTTTAVVGTGVSVLTKWLIGLGVSAAAITTAVIVMNSSEVEKTESIAKVDVVKEQPESKIEETKIIPETQLTKEIEVVTEGSKQQNDVLETYSEEIIEESSTTTNGITKAVDTDKNYILDKPDEAVSNHTVEDIKEKLPVTFDKINEPNELELPVETKEKEAEFSVSQYTNVFSPNGDGRNDEFFLNIDGVVDFYLIVINDKGEAVFKTENTNFRWDGRDLRSEPAPNGSYVYMLSGKDKDGNPIAQTKSLTILRSH
jgi:hypothetical protein